MSDSRPSRLTLQAGSTAELVAIVAVADAVALVLRDLSFYGRATVVEGVRFALHDLIAAFLEL